ncbi:pyroglutamyl-peptidase I [Candidatus Woesearchaeota archaeon]|nr:pyroglutamyl-peptidase I [Candidatus Woesearchaeota archaeon]
MTTLIYTFEKFHNLKSNPAHEVGKAIIDLFNSKDVELIQLPVTYNCWDLLKEKIHEFNPEIVLGLGVAMGINKVKIEKIGLNFKHAEIPDNEGIKIQSEKISMNNSLAFETDIDILNFSDKLKEKGIPAEVSFHAGTYICNYAYYNCLSYLKDKKIKTLFIHVPASPKEVIELNSNIASFPTNLIAEGIFQILKETQL